MSGCGGEMGTDNLNNKHVGLVAKCNSEGVGRIFCWNDADLDVGGKVMIRSDWTNQEVICRITHEVCHAAGFNPILAIHGIQQEIKPYFMLDFEVLQTIDGKEIRNRLLPPHSKVYAIK